ncbi:hypothetical protein [Pseudomonas viridiflava]|uniref:hypothetical protein n=1 Tax=Pseudomonas viridiflava TaxID=33069 RepID=UPI002EAFA1BC|nr:hypothetical protein [Pseudomonas viridiflava]
MLANSSCIGLVSHEFDKKLGKVVTVVKVALKLDYDRALSLEAAISDLYFFTSGEDLYYCYQANMQELLNEVLSLAKGYLDNGSMSDIFASSASFQFSRLTLNLLGMFKSFLDHGAAALSRRYGPESKERRSWDIAQNAEYDRSAAYRFFSNLRNYAQHVGMPPLHFSLKENSEEDGVQVTLEFRRQELLSSYSRWSKDAKRDLESGPESLHLLTLIEEWSICFHRLVKMIQTVRSNEVMASAEQILGLRSEFAIPGDGMLILLPEPTLDDCGQLDLRFRPLPEEKAKNIVEHTFLKMLDQYQG